MIGVRIRVRVQVELLVVWPFVHARQTSCFHVRDGLERLRAKKRRSHRGPIADAYVEVNAVGAGWTSIRTLIWSQS